MSTFLISFANLIPKELALGIYDFEHEGFRWVDLSIEKNAENGLEKVNGAIGLCERDGFYWAITHGNFPGHDFFLLKVDHHGNVLTKYLLEDTRDPHSVMPYENGFLIVDTGFNRLLYYEPSSDDRLLRSVFWQYIESDKDEIHINSVAQYQGDIYVSLFGNMPGEQWSSANAGSILNIRTGEVICEQLMQPHSLLVIDGYLYWLESQRSLVHRYSPDSGHEIVRELTGYVRGIAADDQYIYVSASAKRRKSKSTGAMSSAPTDSEELHHSRIYRLDKDTHEVSGERIITCFGAETYDILPIKENDDIPTQYDTKLSCIRRFWKYEDMVFEFWANEGKLQQRSREKESKIEQLLQEKERITKEKDSKFQQLTATKDRKIEQLLHEKEQLAREFRSKQDTIEQLHSQLDWILKSKRWRYSTALSSLMQKVLKRH